MYLRQRLLSEVWRFQNYMTNKPAVTAFAGALCVAWSVNKTHDMIAVVVIACLGALLQYFVTARSPKRSKIKD